MYASSSHLARLGLVVGDADDLGADPIQLLAQIDRHDRRRRLVRAQAVVVTGHRDLRWRLSRAVVQDKGIVMYKHASSVWGFSSKRVQGSVCARARVSPCILVCASACIGCVRRRGGGRRACGRRG